MPGFNDNEKTARRIAGTFDDPRIRHFFDPFPKHLAGKAFAEGRITRGPAWDIYFFFDRGAEWKEKPPEPVEWIHQLSGGRRADAKLFRTGADLVNGLHDVMHKVTGEQCAVEP